MIFLLLACTDPIETGSFTALTYNVAGLPQGLSSSDPERFIPQISPKLNDYDLVLVQEDFSYNDLLTADITLPYLSEPKTPEEELVNDGLNRFSTLPFTPVERTRWVACFGELQNASDCLAEKGFSVATHTLAESVELMVVNLHAEAGGGDEDREASADGFAQLAQRLAADDRALLVGGDTNLKPLEREQDARTMDAFLQATGLTEVEQRDPNKDHIDRWFIRSGPGVSLSASDWAIDTDMVSPDGDDLSDHPAIQVRIAWEELR